MVYGLSFMVYGSWFMVYGLWFVVCGLGVEVYGLWFMVYDSGSGVNLLDKDIETRLERRSIGSNCIKLYWFKLH